MKIAYVNYYYDENISLDTYFTRYPSIHGWCKAVADWGIQVTVYQRFNDVFTFEKDNVSYYLIKDKNKNNLEIWKNPEIFHGQIITGKPDIIHINSFNYIFQAYLLKKISTPSTILIQHHAEKPWKGIKKTLQRILSSYVDGYIFSSQLIYEKWINSGTLNKEKSVAEIIENSTNFSFGDKRNAKSITGMCGKPIFLWVGRLNENKDPHTVITGFSMLLNDYPDAELYMVYSENDLEETIRKIIYSDKKLINAIKLLEQIDHNDLNDFFNSADYYVSGSHYEGSGYSLIEAMACGTIPVVTDIPSFRTITRNGNVGGLWEPGNPKAFYITARKVIELDEVEQSKKALNIFKADLSFKSLSNKAKQFYEEQLKQNLQENTL